VSDKAEEVKASYPAFGEYEAHPLLAYFPAGSATDVGALEASVLKVGVQTPLTIWKDAKGRTWLVDGRTRQEAARLAYNRLVDAGEPPVAENGVPIQPAVWELAGDQQDMFRYVQGSHIRKHYTESQKAVYGVRVYYYLFRQQHGKRLPPDTVAEVKLGGLDSDELARVTGSNRAYVQIVRAIVRAGNGDDLLDAAQTGTITVKQVKSMYEARQAAPAAGAVEDGPPPEPEPVGEADVVKDGNGNPVTDDKLAEKFRARGAFRAVSKMIADVGRAVEKLSKAPGGENIDFEAVDKSLVAVWNGLRQLMPHEPCGDCAGAGKVDGKKCKRCGKTGYLTPAILKAEKAAAKKGGAQKPEPEPEPAGAA